MVEKDILNLINTANLKPSLLQKIYNSTHPDLQLHY